MRREVRKNDGDDDDEGVGGAAFDGDRNGEELEEESLVDASRICARSVAGLDRARGRARPHFSGSATCDGVVNR